MRMCRPPPQKKKKPKSGKGRGGGSENYNLGLIFYFTSHFIDFSVVFYVFVVTESIYESSEKNRTTRIRKNDCLSQNWGRFAYNMRMLIELEISMPLSFRQSLGVPSQEIWAL